MKTNKSVEQLYAEADKLRDQLKEYEQDTKISKSISASVSDVIIITSFDLNCEYKYVSPSSIHLLGYLPEELIGKSFFDFVHPDDKKQLFKQLKSCLSKVISNIIKPGDRSISETVVFRFKVKNGDWSYIQSTLSFFGTDLISVAHDISDLKLAENKLRSSKEEHKALLDAIPDCIFHLNRKTEITALNRAAAELLRKQPKDLIGSSLTDYKQFKNSKLKIYLDKIYSKKQAISANLAIELPNRKLHLKTTFTPLFDDKKNLRSVICICRDNTETINDLLPLRRVDNKKIKPPENLSQQQDPVKKQINVLIAEDDEFSYLYLTEALKNYCYNFHRAKNGIQAVEILRENKDINLVLMDIKMPEMNGNTATNQIRKFDKNILIIAQTANAFNYERQQSLNAGCDYYLTKPIDINRLIRIIKTRFYE